MIMDDDDGWQFLPEPPKRRKTTSFDKCIFCQTNNDVNLRMAKLSSIEKVKAALEVRQDEVSKRLSPSDLCLIEGKVILWHSSCYETYTSKQNLQYCAAQSSSDVRPEGTKRGTPFDWSKCIFCKNATRKKDKQLIHIATFEASNGIREAAEAREDYELLGVLLSVNYDLIAKEGKYHKSCHASYVSKSTIKHKLDAATIGENAFNEAFTRLVNIITPEIENGKAYDMNTILSMFKNELQKMGNDGESYTKQKLKARLKSHYHDRLVFHQSPQQSKPEIVYSGSISLLDVINAASKCPPSNTTSRVGTAKTQAASLQVSTSISRTNWM